ncbi:RHS repeat-associated core domain-containing protein [Pirellulaceae bacterium SH467]
MDELFADEQKLAGTGYDTFWTLGDHQGTLKDIVDYNPTTGTTSVVNHRRYDAFGNLKSQSGAVVVQFGYTGKFFDATTGFQNSWNRWYSPRLGRFLSQDPIGFDGGDTNLYRYVGNGATNVIDPSGLQERSSWDIESELISIYNQPVRSEADIAKFASLVTQLLRQRELESIRQRERDNQTVMRSATSSEMRDLLDVEMRTIWNRMYIGIATDAEKNRWHQVRRANSPGLALTNDLVGPEGGVWRSIEIAGMMAGGGPVLQNATGASTPKLTTAPVSGGKTVLGHYPAYTELAEQLGARRFNIPTSVWNKMTEVERWEANTKFLDRMIARGDDIILATRADLAKPGSYFARELEFLLSKGFKICADGLRLIAPGAR